MTARRIPRWRDVKPLLGGGPPRRTALEAALTVKLDGAYRAAAERSV